jgi:hypothetical protein
MYKATTEPLLSGSPRPASGPQPVKSFASGTLHAGEYGTLTGFAAVGTPNELDVGPTSAVPQERHKRVIIVGGGINGIQQASTLLRDGCVGLNDIQIFDALDDYGGVWQKNKYPGCACDVPAMIYTTSYNINKSKGFLLALFSVICLRLTVMCRVDAFLRRASADPGILCRLRTSVSFRRLYPISKSRQSVHLG